MSERDRTQGLKGWLSMPLEGLIETDIGGCTSPLHKPWYLHKALAPSPRPQVMEATNPRKSKDCLA
ncbi:Uncharacterised protein [Chlamydia trachomatis]|nr:Uncharacterised protein [Chlamydia trachomatis]